MALMGRFFFYCVFAAVVGHVPLKAIISFKQFEFIVMLVEEKTWNVILQFA